MVLPRPAAVRPKVHSPLSGETLYLEDAVEPWLKDDTYGSVCIFGPSGSGLTTALRHLSAVVPNDRNVLFLDEPDPEQVQEEEGLHLVIYTQREPIPNGQLSSIALAPWDRDSILEYVMARHRSRVSSVLSRVHMDFDPQKFGGQPGLWCALLDRLASDDELPDLPTALHDELLIRLPGSRLAALARAYCLDRILRPDLTDEGAVAQLRKRGCDEETLGLLHHEIVQRVLVVGKIYEDLGRREKCAYLAGHLPLPILKAVARRIATDPYRLDRLHRLMKKNRSIQPAAATILHHADVEWRPEKSVRNFLGSDLSGAFWRKIRLTRTDLRDADLSGADLSESSLKHIDVTRGNLRGAKLGWTYISGFMALAAHLEGANFTKARIKDAVFSGAWLNQAGFAAAHLPGASFVGADCRNVDFEGAELWRADFSLAKIESANFHNAHLDEAFLKGMDLTLASFRRTRFWKAILRECNLTGMNFWRCGFECADLSGALLTGARFRKCSFMGASLRGARLADVDLEGAVLGNVDFSHAQFHMGTTRSGLLFEGPSEGTRSGFYNDDYSEMIYRAPEEYRSANLRGAYLRGAIVKDTDFYLVDLREAHYSRDQEFHFRKCKAIL